MSIEGAEWWTADGGGQNPISRTLGPMDMYVHTPRANLENYATSFQIKDFFFNFVILKLENFPHNFTKISRPYTLKNPQMVC